jgi:predicted transcriptional regulator
MNSSKIPEAELEVLACLDRLGGATARELRETMGSYRPMAHGSVMTLLKRLEVRELVGHRKADRGKAFVFFPTERARATYAGLMQRLRQRIFADDPVALMASLFDGAPPDSEQIEELQSLLDELRQAGEGG